MLSPEMTVAFDPGETTGVAWSQGGTIYTNELPYDSVMHFMEDDAITEVVVELFATAGRISRYGLRTVELVGMLNGWCLANGILFTKQTPSSRKGYQLEAESFYGAVSLSNHRRRSKHENDALAHLLRYLAEKGTPLVHRQP